MTETRTILGDIYDALREQNLDQLASYLPNDFCHTINFPPEIHPVGGIRRGKPATLARLGQIFSEFECVQLDTSG